MAPQLSLIQLLSALAQQQGTPNVPAPARPLPLIAQTGPTVTPPTMMPGAPPPSPAPPAPAPPLDQGLISQFAGQAPTPPVAQQPSGLQRLANALIGFGAGVQGNGPQFLAQLREQQQEPIRNYQRQLEQYNQRRQTGLEVATRKQERQQAATQRAADEQSDREFKMWLQRTGVTDEQAAQQLRQAFEIQKLREQERIADERDAARQKALDLRQARTIEAQLVSKDGAPPRVARELSEYIAGIRTELSPNVEKWRGLQAEKIRAQINRLARIGAGGGSSAPTASAKAQKALQQFEATKQKLIDAVSAGNAAAQKQVRTELNARFRYLGRFPEIEAGFDPSNQWPYAKVRGAQAPAQAQPQQQAAPQNPKDPLGIR
jgi:hypothetical protein